MKKYKLSNDLLPFVVKEIEMLKLVKNTSGLA